MTLRYVRQTDGSFKKEGEVTSRYVLLRTLKNGLWRQETITPLLRTTMVAILEKGDCLPAEAYELVPVESTLTDEDRERLKQIKKRKAAERGETDENI